MKAIHFRKLTLITGALFSVVSGAYLGLHACGSYSWHWELQSTLGLLLSTVWVAFTIYIYRSQPLNERRPFIAISLCIGIYFAMHAIFMTSMAITGPFYPATPSSLSEWWQGFLFTWREGVPC